MFTEKTMERSMKAEEEGGAGISTNCCRRRRRGTAIRRRLEASEVDCLQGVVEVDEALCLAAVAQRGGDGDGGAMRKWTAAGGLCSFSFLAWRGRRKGEEEIRRSR
jgi:hypothetical protein